MSSNIEYKIPKESQQPLDVEFDQENDTKIQIENDVANDTIDEVKSLNEDTKNKNDELKIEKTEVKDSYYLCSIYTVIFGIAVLLPFNALITATSYFVDKLKDRDDLINIFSATLNTSSTIPNVIAFFINTFYIYKFDHIIRVYVSLGMMMVGFIIVIAFVPVDVTPFQTGFFATMMIAAVILAGFSSIGQAAFFAIFAFFPFKYILHFLLGQAIAGILVNFIDIAIIGSDYSPVVSGSLYFASAIISMVVSIICFYLFHTNKYFKYRMSNVADAENVQKNKNISIKKTFQVYCKIFKKVWVPVGIVFFTFEVTLMYFPGLTLAARSTLVGTEWADKYFISVYCFLIFNIADALGKELPQITPFVKGDSVILFVFTLARLFFLPFFLIVNKVDNSYIPAVIKSDAAPIILNFLFGFTNGYYSSVAFNDVVGLVEPEYAEMTNTLMVLVLGLGLAIGSFLSYAFNLLVYY